MDWQAMRTHQTFRIVILTLPYMVCKPFRVRNPCNPSKCIDNLWGPPFFLCRHSCTALYGMQAFYGSQSIQFLKTDGQVMRLTHLFGVITLVLHFMVCKPFMVNNLSNPSKRMDKLWGQPIFSVSSLWYCLVWYTSLVGIRILGVPYKKSIHFEAPCQGA